MFAMVAKSQSNPVFESARFGAEDAALEIGQKLKVDIEIIWRTPNEEDAQKQVEYIGPTRTTGCQRDQCELHGSSDAYPGHKPGRREWSCGNVL